MPCCINLLVRISRSLFKNALVRFIGKEELDINLITLDFLEDFKSFLNKEREIRTKRLMQQGKRVPSNRSLSLYLISIKKLFNEAKKRYNKKDKNLILIPNSPFIELEIPKQEATRKRAISSLRSLVLDRKSTRLNSSHCRLSRMPSSA